MPDQFVFVPADGFGKTTMADRSLIRSRCMKGKNKRDDSRRSMQKAKRAATAVSSSSSSSSSPSSSSSSPEASGPDEIPAAAAAAAAAAATSALALCKPPPPDLALVRFAGDSGRESQQLMYDYFTYHSRKTVIYPVDSCVDFSQGPPDFFRWLAMDPAYFHSVLLTTSAFGDFMYRRPPTRATYHHLRRTLFFLNEKLSEKDAHLVDSNVYIVTALAFIAHILGDYSAADAHMSGLAQIVRLRGGLKYLRSNPKQHFRITSLDLSLALSTGERSHFLTNAVSWDPIYPFSALPPNYPASLQSDHGPADPRLVIVFHDLQHLVGLINHHFSKNSRLKGSTFQDSINSIQSRLLQLSTHLGSTTDKCLCFGMLAFLSTMFLLPSRKVSYGHLAARLRAACQVMKTFTPELQNFLCWMLVVGSITVFEADEPWLGKRWSEMAGSEPLLWEEARRRAQSVMWIDYMHDARGEQAFAVITCD